jgi:hypothetical protein
MIDRRVKPGRLLLRWRERPGEGEDPDFVVTYPRKCDGSLVMSVLFSERGFWNMGEDHRSFVEELERRGYDPTTLRFSIDPTPAPPEEK